MISAQICRALILALGYLFPAYKCFKSVKVNKPEPEQLRSWCQYWILVAFLTVSGAFTDAFFSWFPFYHEAKLFAFLFLWYPQTKGATFIYKAYVGPYLTEHESEIDRALFESRARAVDAALLARKMVASYLQTMRSNRLV
ncbi:HVA22-like protein i [Zingiber officinale]|uniref:HVA22-like protein i n=1 Tax=Zingiber officinale TaxID=94328 RepID=UPI001C4DA35B|nr:HVA22-like protein i [Zingiber officinale]